MEIRETVSREVTRLGETQWREVQLRVPFTNFYQHFSIMFDILSSTPEQKNSTYISLFTF